MYESRENYYSKSNKTTTSGWGFRKTEESGGGNVGRGTKIRAQTGREFCHFDF